MKFRRLGLRGKFLAALLIAAGIPLVVGLVVLGTVGYQGLLQERGKMHRMEALTLVQAIRHASNEEGRLFLTWVEAAPVMRDFVAACNSANEAAGEDKTLEETARLDAAWAGLAPDAPALRAVLENPAAENLNGYLKLHPEIAEVIITDRRGRLVAANEKTSDYNQADEGWWWTGSRLRKGEVWTDTLRFDESSDAFTLDVVVALRDAKDLVGVAKLSVDVSSLFTNLGFDGEAKGERWEIVLPDGRILASSRSGHVSLAESVPPTTLRAMQDEVGRGILPREKEGEPRMAGFVAMGDDAGNPGAYVVFSSRRDEVVGPLRRTLAWIAAGAGVLVLLSAAGGYVFIRRKILNPLEALGGAARAISATAKLHGGGRDDELIRKKRAEAEADLQCIKAIQTGDEVEALADDLAVMTTRVLRYQREMEAEVEAKTAVIREDLEMARQFQNALLPSDYPDVPPPEVSTQLRLKFAHFYQPASTVGGDFFDLLELSDDCAGVLIADVMGHGARSALVTAILRALVRNHTETARDPGAFLSELNRHLHDVISRSGQTLFVTAFLLVLDTRNGVASWAVAGHPAPLRARRGSGRDPEPLWHEPPRQPALGLVPNVAYRTNEAPLRSGDVFLLYTDGAVEAENPQGEAFGVNRLAKCFDEALDGPMAAMPAKIVCEVTAFQRRAQYDDDVCLVAVEAGGGGMPRGA